IGDNGTMAARFDHTQQFRGATFLAADLTGARFRDCDLRQVTISGSWLIDVTLSGFVGSLVVNDVDVTAFVQAELDRRHPDRLGLTQTSYPAPDAAALGLDPDARPSLADVMVARAERMARVRGIVDGLGDADLDRPCSRAPAPGYPEESRPVGTCLRVLMTEE